MITINFLNGVDEVTASTPIYQWDYGRKLRITGEGLPSLNCYVHFANSKSEETINRVANNVNGGLEVAIPDVLIDEEYPIHAYVFLNVDTEGKTIKHIIIPIVSRTKSSNKVEPVTPSEQAMLEEMIAHVNATYDELTAKYDKTITYGELEEQIKETIVEEVEKRIEIETPEKIKKVKQFGSEGSAEVGQRTYSIEFQENDGKPIFKTVEELEGSSPTTSSVKLATETDINNLKKVKTSTGTGSIAITLKGVYLISSPIGDFIISIPDLNKDATSGIVCFYDGTKMLKSMAVYSSGDKKVSIIESTLTENTSGYTLTATRILG